MQPVARQDYSRFFASNGVLITLSLFSELHNHASSKLQDCNQAAGSDQWTRPPSDELDLSSILHKTRGILQG